jgi:hypothetical protein
MNKPMDLLVPYPPILTEEETLDRVLAGASCSRYGDGELRLALGGSASAQVPDLNLQAELVSILRGPTRSLVCLPHYKYGPKIENWKKYGTGKFVRLFRQPEYGSAFISRPDSAPEINNQVYWAKVRSLWAGRDTTLVVGTDATSLNEKMLRDVKSLRVVFGPRRDAYFEVSRLEQEIGTTPADAPIILCLGPTATVLAERLARKGCWAIDLGHMGKLMPKEYR